jgi:multidrug efflux pump subunit AcrB
LFFSLEDKDKTNLQDIQNLKIKETKEYMIPISDLVKVKQILYKKTFIDQKRVVYVTADMAGAMESQCMPFWND